MNYRITFTESTFRDLVHGLANRPNARGFIQIGQSRLAASVEYLAHGVHWHGPAASGPPLLAIARASTGGGEDAVAINQELPSWPEGAVGALLVVGTGDRAGQFGAVHVNGGDLAPIQRLSLIQSQLPIIDLSGNPKQIESEFDAAVWSRSIGALSKDVWGRLTSLHFAVIGCGRTGSLVATGLGRLGVRQLTIIDPDKLESHNIGEMEGVTIQNIGDSKTKAMAAFLWQYGGSRIRCVEAVPESILSVSALTAVKSVDFLFCCVDDPLARLACDFLAKLYLKPLIDVGTGILSNRRMGADVRLVLPEHCLSCVGGITDTDRIRLEIPAPDLPNSLSTNWRMRRAGSLRSLNQIAVGAALRLVEEFVEGRVRSSTWLQLDVDTTTALPIFTGSAPATSNANCPVCGVVGRGDGGVHLLPTVVRGLQS